MPSLNRVQLLGNLGRDPELRYTADGAAIATLSIATSHAWKDKEGERHEETEWTRVVLFGRQAEVAGDHLRKGSQCLVEGRLRTRKWQDKETGQDRYTTEVVADNLILLGSRADSAKPAAQEPDSEDAAPSGDVPF